MTRTRTSAADRVDDLAALFEQLPILGGREVPFSSGVGGVTCRVEHGLGRCYRGAFAVSYTSVGSTDVYPMDPDLAAKAGYDTRRYLILNAPANAVLTLWVY